VHLAIGDHHYAGEALARYLRHRPIECREQPGPVVAGTGLRLSRPDYAEVEVTLPGELIFECGERGLGRVLPVANTLARRLVDDDDRDVALR